MSPQPSFETLASVILRIVPHGSLNATRHETSSGQQSYIGTNLVRFVVCICDQEPACVRYDLGMQTLALERIDRFRLYWTPGQLYDLLTEFESDTQASSSPKK